MIYNLNEMVGKKQVFIKFANSELIRLFDSPKHGQASSIIPHMDK